MSLSNSTLTAEEAVREMLESIGGWWKVSFPPAIVILLIFIFLGKFVGWFVSKVLVYGADDFLSTEWDSMTHLQKTELRNVGAWKHLQRGFTARNTIEPPIRMCTPEEIDVNVKGPGARSSAGNVLTGVSTNAFEESKDTKTRWQRVSDKAGDWCTWLAAKCVRMFWKGGLSQDAAVVIGHVISIIVYAIGVLVSLSYAGLQMCVSVYATHTHMGTVV
jgi:hypothetical protein